MKKNSYRKNMLTYPHFLLIQQLNETVDVKISYFSVYFWENVKNIHNLESTYNLLTQLCITRDNTNGISLLMDSSLAESRWGRLVRQFRSRWHHRTETFSTLLALCVGNSPVTGEFPSQRPVTQSFDVFFDLHMNKRLRKQSRHWWFKMSSCS